MKHKLRMQRRTSLKKALYVRGLSSYPSPPRHQPDLLFLLFSVPLTVDGAFVSWDSCKIITFFLKELRISMTSLTANSNSNMALTIS
jgi:hypothetical protein